jgi:hypothetical protein
MPTLRENDTTPPPYRTGLRQASDREIAARNGARAFTELCRILAEPVSVSASLAASRRAMQDQDFAEQLQRVAAWIRAIENVTAEGFAWPPGAALKDRRTNAPPAAADAPAARARPANRNLKDCLRCGMRPTIVVLADGAFVECTSCRSRTKSFAAIDQAALLWNADAFSPPAPDRPEQFPNRSPEKTPELVSFALTRH